MAAQNDRLPDRPGTDDPGRGRRIGIDVGSVRIGGAASDPDGYAEAMETVFRAWPDIPITENHIRQLHRDLLRYSDKDEWHRGNYKTSPNNVAAFDENGNENDELAVVTQPQDQIMQRLLLRSVRAPQAASIKATVP